MSEFEQNYKRLLSYYTDANKERKSINKRFWTSLNLEHKPLVDLLLVFFFVIIGVGLRITFFLMKCLAFYLVGYLLYLAIV